MDVTDVVLPYEILIRFDEEGAFKGAHQVRRRVTTLPDGRRFEEILPAEAVEPGGFAGVMGEVAARAVVAAGEALAARDRALEARAAAGGPAGAGVQPFMDGSAPAP